MPVVSLPRIKMQARVAGGLLIALGMPELLARDKTDYGVLITAIASRKEAMGRLRARVRERRAESMLFDTGGWVLEAERMQRMLWELFAAGKVRSVHLVVAPR